jgi:hypothetical protein
MGGGICNVDKVVAGNEPVLLRGGCYELDASL